MSKELVISANRHETRVALIDEDQLVEVYFQRANEYSLAGSIHKGRVTRVLPGMQSAFVDLGLERDTFLYVTDFLEESDDIDHVGAPDVRGEARGDVRGDTRPSGEGRPPRDQDRDRDRGRGRDRGRDRDRDRERRPVEAAPPPPLSEVQPAQALGEIAGEAPLGEVLPPEALAAGGEITAEASAPPASARPEGPRADGPRPDGRGPDGRRPDNQADRGRRSRRRRRGRGFPDSKYASGDATATPAESDAPEEEEVAEAFVPEPVSTSPLVLPGETLRKYSGAAPVAMPPPLPAMAPLAESSVVEAEFESPVIYPPENALPDAPAHASPIQETSEEESAHESADEPRPTLAGPGEEPAEGDAHADVHGDVQGEEDEPAVGAHLLDEDEDRDIQAMILGASEGIDVVREDEEGQDGESEEDGEQAEGAETAEASAEGTSGEPATGSAQVRERSERYPHRVSSRRMRRRGRGGDRSDRGDRPAGDRPPGDRPAGERSPETREPRAEAAPREQNREQNRERTVARPAVQTPSITDLLKEGQEIIVQIAKEPLGQKGARITSHIALPGRYVVFMPTLEHMGVSRKIASDEERLRLKRILQGKRPGPIGGFITRTAAEGRTEDEIGADMQFLYNLWQDIRNKAEKRPAPMLLHHDLDIVQRILRDQLADSFKAIWIDSEETYESVLSFVERFQPALVPKVKLYTREAPIFDAFGVTAELEKALRPKVWLKSGGYIVINQTEALVAIDVNTGKFVGKSNRLEDTIVKTNTEAIKEIVRQIRLRDLGGIIVIDFIDMDERKNRQKVMQVLEEAMRVDRAPYKILQFNDFGLVAITRKRVKQSLERTLCSPCPHCDGAGYVKSVQTVVSEILTEARKMSGSVEGKEVVLRVHPDVAKVLKSHQNKYLEELEEVMRRPVLIKSDALLHHEKFDLA